MRWVLLIVGMLAAVLAVAAIVGWSLPMSHEAARTEHFAHSAQRVYDIVVDVPGYRNWLADRTPVEIVEARPPTRIVTRVADRNLPFGGSWTFDLRPAGDGVNVTITERGEVYNPLFRFISRFVMGHTATMDAYLRDLRKALRSG